MKSSRSLPGLLVVLGACQGMIADAPTYEAHDLQASHDDGADTSVQSAAGSGAVSARDAAQRMAAAADGGSKRTSEEAGTPQTPELPPPTATPEQPAQTALPEQPASHTDMALRVGDGDMARPIDGPTPVDSAKLGGEPFKLVKNWDFGSQRHDQEHQGDLDAEFQYHDQFGTIANGSNYGAVTVAPERQLRDPTASVSGCQQQTTARRSGASARASSPRLSLLTYVRPLSDSQSTVSANRHNAGNGSFTAKWSLPNGGELLGHDVVWESRVRMPKPVPGYWFALWNAGKLWDKGAEMDVLESFGTPNISADAFHSDSVGGNNTVDFKSWPNGLDSAGVPPNDRELSDWHIWTWIYLPRR